MSEGAYLTVAEVAKRWRVSRMTVYRMVDDGTLYSIRIGRQIRIERRSVARIEEAAGVHDPQ